MRFPQHRRTSSLFVNVAKRHWQKEFKNPALFRREAPVSSEEANRDISQEVKQNSLANRKVECFIYNLPEVKIPAEYLPKISAEFYLRATLHREGTF